MKEQLTTSQKQITKWKKYDIHYLDPHPSPNVNEAPPTIPWEGFPSCIIYSIKHNNHDILGTNEATLWMS